MSLLLFFRSRFYDLSGTLLPTWSWHRTVASRMPARTVASRMPERTVRLRGQL